MGFHHHSCYCTYIIECISITLIFISSRAKRDRVSFRNEKKNIFTKYTDDEDMQYYVGDFDASSSSLSLRPCGSIQVLRTPSESISTSTWDENTAREHRLYRTDRMKQIHATNELTEMFGSRKAKRAKHTRERGRITQDGISSHAQSTIEERRRHASTIAAEKIDLAANALMESRRRILPSFDLDANRVQDAYDLSSILSDAETRLYLANVLNAFRKQLSGASTNSPSKYAFVGKTLQRLRATKDVSKRDEALPRLAYVFSLSLSRQARHET